MLPFRVVAKLQHRSAASPRPASSRRNLCSPCDSALDLCLSFVFSNFQLSTFDFQPPLFPKSFPCHTSENGPVSPLAATLMDLPASVANKRLTAWLSPLAATLTKNRRGGGAMVLPGRTSIRVRCPDLSPLFATLTKTAGCGPKIPMLEGGVLPTFKRSTFKPSNDHLVPLQPNALGATMSEGAGILRAPGKQLRSPRCLR